MPRPLAIAALTVTCAALLSPDGCSEATAADLAWSLVDNSSPTPRYRHAMAFDSDRGEVVLFGGNTGETDTWVWDTHVNQWHLAATSGPNRRGDHAMVYDPIRKKIVLTGGYYNGVAFKDVWEWDGATATWTLREPGAWLPDVRTDHAMAYDSDRHRIVLYGGNSSSANANKTLEFDGNTWSIVTTSTTMGSQFALGMAYDQLRKRVVSILSGFPWPMIPTPFYEYGATDGQFNWEAPIVPTSVPNMHTDPTVVYDSWRGETLMYGGILRTSSGGASGTGDTWTYDGAGWTAHSAGPRRHHNALVFDSIHGEALSYSGNAFVCACDAFRDIQAWDGSAWTQRWIRYSLTPVFAPAMTYDESRGRVVLFGGLRLNPFNFGNVPPLDTTWEWDGTTWTYSDTAHNPGTRYRAPLVYDSIRGRTVLFGGVKNGADSSAVAETWFYDGVDWTQGPLAAKKRARHGIAFDRKRDRVVVFGGQDENAAELGDTFEFDGTAWTQVATTGPSARRWPVLAYDEARQRTVLFGGAAGSTLLNDTWEWDGQSWTQVDIPLSQRPPARAAAGFTYDPDRKVIVMVAGHASASGGTAGRDDTWVFDGQSWTQLNTPSTIAKTYFGFAYDRDRQVFVLAGGSSVSDYAYSTAQTWEASFGCAAAPGDLDCDGAIGAPDIAILLGAWGSDSPMADLDGDGSVGASDLAVILGNWQ